MTNNLKRKIRESVALELVEGNLFEQMIATTTSCLYNDLIDTNGDMTDEQVEYLKKEARKIMGGAFDRAERSAQRNECSVAGS